MIYTPAEYADLVARGIDPGLPLQEDTIRHAIARTPPPHAVKRKP